MAHAKQHAKEDSEQQVTIRQTNLDTKRDGDHGLLVGCATRTQATLDGPTFCCLVLSLPEDAIADTRKPYQGVYHASDVDNVHESKPNCEEIGQEGHDSCVMGDHPHHHIDIMLCLEGETNGSTSN